MRLSIQRLRWVLIAGAVLLVGVLALYIGYGRYRALNAYRQILARSGVTLTRDSNGVTYSQSVKGKKIFTVRAKTESTLGNGRYALHDAEMLLYTRSEDHPDHIYGSEMEYDQNEGILRAKGEVFMDLQPPQGLTNEGHATAQRGSGGHAVNPVTMHPVPAKPASEQIIHVRTSGLVYVRKLAVASTDQQVDFSYGGMQCTSIGAEFNSDQNTLRLLSDVRMDGLAHGQPLHVTATRADVDRDANIAHLTHPVAVSNGRSAKSDTAILNLRKDGSIERLQGLDHVVISSRTQRITANRLDATLTQQSVPETGRLSGSVVMVDTNPLRPMNGTANAVDAIFDAQGMPTSVTASGAAKLSMVDRRSNPGGLARSGLARSMDGAKIVALFVPGQVPGKHRSSSLLKEVHAMGSAHASGESFAVPAKGSVVASSAVDTTKPLPLKNVQVWADDLRILFLSSASGRAQPQKLYGTGHTILQQDAPLGEQEISNGDTLQMVFAQATTLPANGLADKDATNISSAVQSGHVTIHDRAASKAGSSEPGAVSTGTGDTATFDGAAQRLTLSGNAHLYGDNASLIAPAVTLDQRTQDAEANGGVQATFQNASATTSQNSSSVAVGSTAVGAAAIAKPAPLTHVLSASAHFYHATKLAYFYGTDAQPARIWQNASQVQAATLLFDGVKRTFSARPEKPEALIHAVFASNPSMPKQGASPRAASIIRVASPKMDYNDLLREATFTGGVSIDGTLGQVRGQRAVVFLVPKTNSATEKQTERASAATLQAQPSPLNGSIDRVVVEGSVQLDQPGRHGTGEQLLYTAANGSYVLTGTPTNPPHIVDAQQGSVTGTTLLFSGIGSTGAGSTIVIVGDPNAPKGKGGRVRTETHVSPGKEERQ